MIKDVLHLVYLSESLGLKEVADYWRMVISINDYQKNRFTDLVVNKLTLDKSNNFISSKNSSTISLGRLCVFME